MTDSIDSKQAAGLGIDEVFTRLQSGAGGLSTEQAAARLSQVGRNTLEEAKPSRVRKLLGYFWGPIPWMIEAAAILSALARHWDDFVIIVILLVFNAAVGFWQEYKAANALDALKRQLALRARVRRDGRWKELDAAELVPGDVIRLRLGDIIPADAKLIEGDYLSVDQSALTGESLPVNKTSGELVYSGSVARQGEMVALVTATGSDTFFGHTARLVETAGAASHFQKAVLAIGDYLIYLSLGLVAILLVVQLFRHAPPLELVQFALILTVASIPVAMPAVLSVTMAVGALALSRMKAIVARLQSIEEMAGVDILCSDKTGTLTRNALTLGEPAVFAASDAQDLILAAALASRAEDGDAIDLAVLGGLTDQTMLGRYTQTRFVPFDPVSKRTEAEIAADDGGSFKVSKGAPQVILQLSDVDQATAERAGALIDRQAAKGYRTLGVARTDEGGRWRFLGILPLFDPPRADSAQTIREAGRYGIKMKMVTGDNAAIAREIAARLGLGTDIQPATALFDADSGRAPPDAAERIEAADGFAQVFPEHKYAI
ncbi:MAG: plasma-membrane proton-efflux P-type ATPase, partial [Chromatiales bacterium]